MIRYGVLLLALCLGAAQAQKRIEATPLGRLLEAATTKGLFARVEGVRHYRLGGGDELVLIQVDVKRDGQELYLQSTVNHLDSKRPSLRAVNLHLGPAGQVVKLRLILRTPEQEVTATGKLIDGEIEFEFKEGTKSNTQAFPWSDQTVPGNVVLFVLPCFYELLPKDGWSFVQFDEQGLASGPRKIRAERTPDGARVLLSHSKTDALQAEAVLNQNGRLVSLIRGEQRIVAITAREAARLTEEAQSRRTTDNKRRHAKKDTPPEGGEPKPPETPEKPEKPEQPAPEQDPK